MGHKKTKYEECIDTLKELNSNYPTSTLGQHVATALADYGDIWCISDKEFLFALNKYKEEMALDQGTPVKDIEKIIKEGMNLDTILNEDDEDEDSDDRMDVYL